MKSTLKHTERDPVRCPTCGELGPVGQMFAIEALQSRCGGTGVLRCECADKDGSAGASPSRKSNCTCHHHGAVACDGCDDCLPRIEREVAAAAVSRAEESEAGD